MHTTFLSLPVRSPQPDIWATQNPKETKAWVKRLPTANHEQVAKLLLTRLQQLNQVEAEPVNLFECAELLRPAIYQLLDHYAEKPIGKKFPLSKEDRELSQQLQSISIELTTSYWSVAAHLVTSPPKQLKKLGPTLVQRTLAGLAQIVLLNYLHKQAEPVGIWLDIHQLFIHFRHDSDKIVTDKVARGLPKTSISASYKQLLLLKLAQPYGLLKSEIIELFFLLEKWSDLIELNILDNNPTENNTACLIDFHDDSPASWQPYLGHIDLTNLLRLLSDHEEFVDDTIGRFETTTEKTAQQSISHGLIQHLEKSWNGHNLTDESLFEAESTRICTFGITPAYKSLSSSTEEKPVAPYEFLADTLEENTLQATFDETEVLALGQLISFRPMNRPRQQLMLAITTDIRHEGTTLQFKLSLLTNKPYPATIQPLDCGDRPSHVVPVIIYFTQDSHGNKKTWVIVESKNINAGDRVQLVTSNRTVIANVLSKKHIGTWCYLLQCEISKAF
jgi:hypothetical protein